MCRAGFGNVKSFEKSTLPKTIKNYGIIILIPSKCYLDLTILFNLKLSLFWCKLGLVGYTILLDFLDLSKLLLTITKYMLLASWPFKSLSK